MIIEQIGKGTQHHLFQLGWTKLNSQMSDDLQEYHFPIEFQCLDIFLDIYYYQKERKYQVQL